MMFGKAPCSLSVKIARCKPGMAAIFFPPVGGLYHLTSNKHIFSSGSIHKLSVKLPLPSIHGFVGFVICNLCALLGGLMTQVGNIDKSGMQPPFTDN
jgi:hypothetical protein